MSNPPKTVAEIRQSFLDFFKNKGHTIVPTSSLIPINDPTLMFTNSGMVQFKDVFLGTDKRPYQRAVSVQACLRAGGKHNDLENVGYTARHHTFFEMLGNWSFGDYFKRESLIWGWELLTQVYGLPKDKLLATIYIDDDEAYNIWLNDIGMPPERIIRIGDNKGKKYASDNFWMMADTGPCGPCSEIFYDHGEHIPGGPPGSLEEDGDRFIEIWNHVFMQFDMCPDGTLVKLPAPCVDTGMGLERLAAVLQHVHSNYEIDLFTRLIAAVSRETQCIDLRDKSLRVIADHIRACTFLVADGIIPGNEGRGYVLRRIVRRAIRHGYKLGQKTPFFHQLVKDVVKEMGEAYPKIVKDERHIAEVIKAEEIRFFETLAAGMSILESNLADGGKMLSGEIAFKLHDTFGFPLDLSVDVCREADVNIDIEEFDRCMQAQKNKARAAGKFKMERILDYQGSGNQFVGYESLAIQSIVLALYVKGAPVSSISAGQDAIVVLDKTPFYAESGGQVGDCGILHNPSVKCTVSDTQKIKADVFGHHSHLSHGTLTIGDTLYAQVDEAERAATMRNHSATHLLHKALQDVLGKKVEQKGSLVNGDRTRFDFSHSKAISIAEIHQIEKLVNEAILRNKATNAQQMSLEEAKKTGAMMLFGEKYGEQVRVLQIDESCELCGGTHVARTGDIGLFSIISESGVAAGVRRIEGVTGLQALAQMQHLQTITKEVSARLSTTVNDILGRVDETLAKVKTLEKENTEKNRKLAAQFKPNYQTVGNVHLAAQEVQGIDSVTMLKDILSQARLARPDGIVVLATHIDNKTQLGAAVGDKWVGKIKAGELINFVAQQLGGKGGGKADLAMAGAACATSHQLTQALASVKNWLLATIN